MKTTKLFSVLSFALMVIGVNAANYSNDMTFFREASSLVRYQVNIDPAYRPNVVDTNHSIIICGVLVVVTNGSGKQVAPAQTYTPGVSTYNFYEAGPVTGTRVARLVSDPNSPCPRPNPVDPNQLEIQKGTFPGGTTTRFHLAPPKPAAKD